MKTIFDLCKPRTDVAEGRLKDDELAADLGKVLAKTAAPEYKDAALFFQHTYPTRGLRALLETVCRRLSGKGGELNSVIRLDTQFGGGKTHGLIAIVHAVRGMQGVKSPEEFLDPSLLPQGKVRIAALDGENSDPANGRDMGEGVRAYSLWGELAYQLAGKEGYERVRKSDEAHVAPGAETIAGLFGGEPTLILIDEVALYLRKVAPVHPHAPSEFVAFAQALFKAVSSTPNVCLVLTLAVRADDKEATDAYRSEQQLAMHAFDEAESVAGRKTTQLNPTEEDETVAVLCRRLFERVDSAGAETVVNAYVDVWNRNRETLHADATNLEAREQFKAGYPFHPETLATLVEKTATLTDFQRIRGMLRILARTVHLLWKQHPADAHAIHPHHIDPGYQPIRDEFTTKLHQGAYISALSGDIAAVAGTQPATAQQIDRTQFPAQPPIASYVARTIFLHSLAYPESAQGITPDRLRYAVCSPSVEPSFVEAARKSFIAESLYLDDRPASPLRFLTEANLNQMIRKAVAQVDAAEARKLLNEKIKDVFRTMSSGFELVAFPSGPYEVPDDIADGKPYLVVLGYDAFTVSDEPTALPAEIMRLATKAGANEDLRKYQNNLVFLAANDRLRSEMRQSVLHRLALDQLRRPDRMKNLADHQQRIINERYEKSSLEMAVAIMQCYRHLFYPSSVGLGSERIAHTAVEVSNASDNPGNGQAHLKRALKAQKKLLGSGDDPDAPSFVRDQTPLKTKGQLTTLELRNEYRRAPKLSILLDDDPFVRCIREGIEDEVFIYRDGDMVWGKGDPLPKITISENAFVHTLADAQKLKLWPRKVVEPELREFTPIGPPVPPGSTTGPRTLGPQGTTVEPVAPSTPSALHAQGPLHQAIQELFEKARSARIKRLREVSITLFRETETWNVFPGVAMYREADARASFKVEFNKDGVERFCLDFAGTINEASKLKSFLEPLLRTTRESQFEGEYKLFFKSPLPTGESEAEAFAKAMTKQGGGEAYVEARAAEAES